MRFQINRSHLRLAGLKLCVTSQDNKKLYRPFSHLHTRDWNRTKRTSGAKSSSQKSSNTFTSPHLTLHHVWSFQAVEEIKMAKRERVWGTKRLLFMKIYNFAMEVYDSPGSRIGCCGSCEQQEWELISHEVLLQLLFSTAHPLNTSNTSFFLGALYVQHACAALLWGAGSCACVILPKNMGDRSSARRRGVCAMLTWL